MAKRLTKKAKFNAEKSRISSLTNEHDAYFKIIFSHQIDKKHNFHSMSTRNKMPITPAESIQIYRAFGKFMDECVRLTMSEVEDKYRRPTDKHEANYDPESKDIVQVEHYCLYEEGSVAYPLTDGVRMHGYTRTKGGYFVVTRLDWFHAVNKAGK